MQTLLVDDDVEMRLLLGEVLRARGHEVLACADAETMVASKLSPPIPRWPVRFPTARAGG